MTNEERDIITQFIARIGGGAQQHVQVRLGEGAFGHDRFPLLVTTERAYSRARPRRGKVRHVTHGHRSRSNPPSLLGTQVLRCFVQGASLRWLRKSVHLSRSAIWRRI
jgi:hypothetical protein